MWAVFMALGHIHHKEPTSVLYKKSWCLRKRSGILFSHYDRASWAMDPSSALVTALGLAMNIRNAIEMVSAVFVFPNLTSTIPNLCPPSITTHRKLATMLD